MEHLVSGEHVKMVLDDLHNRFMAEYKEAQDGGYFIKAKRLWWQIVTIGMVRKRLEHVPIISDE